MIPSAWTLFVLVSASLISLAYCQFQWQIRDSIDEIRKRLDRVNSENCRIIDRNGLLLPSSTVTHVPDLKWLGIDPVFPNRTNLLHVHNMALSRAFFYRFVHLKYGQQFNFLSALQQFYLTKGE